MHGALSTQQLGPGFVNEPDSDRVHPDFRAAAAHPKHQMGARVHRREPTHPHMLEDAEDGELTLLINQGVVGQNCEVDLQLRTPGSR
jgi:hypothetical protein